MSTWRRMALVGIAMAASASDDGFAQSVEAYRAAASTKHSERLPSASLPAVVSASADPNGRIVLGGAIEAPVQRISEPADSGVHSSSRGSPCAGASALPADEARRLVEATAREERFQPELVIAVAKAESRFVSTSVSPKGAYGLMQLTPATAQTFGVNICDAKDNVRGGIAFLRELTAKYRNPVYVLAAYNAGEPAILKAKGLPPTAETVGYVATVLNDVYQWPAISKRGEAFGTLPGGAGADPAEDTTRPVQRTGRPARQITRGEAVGWQGGFVQNFD